jgi:hypothetical protein
MQVAEHNGIEVDQPIKADVSLKWAERSTAEINDDPGAIGFDEVTRCRRLGTGH